MSSYSQAPSSPAITSREGHEGVPLLFDVRARGLRPSTQSSAVIGLLVMLIEMGRMCRNIPMIRGGGEEVADKTLIQTNA